MYIESFPSFIILLGVLVFVHEFGHFIVAKRLGIKVLRFSLGFGPILWRKQGAETEYVLSAIPLGGYVKLYGEEPEGEAPPAEAETPAEPVEPHRMFSSRPVSHRAMVVAAGPLMNLVLGFVLFSFLSLLGEQVLLPVVGKVEEGMPAYNGGMLAGDKILKIDDKNIDSWNDIKYNIMTSGTDDMVVVVERNGEKKSLTLKPIIKPDSEFAVIGIGPSGEVTTKPGAPFYMAPVEGFKQTWEITEQTFDVVKRLVTGRGSKSEIGGPIAIFSIAGETMRAGFRYFLYLMAALSVNLTVLNILPVPVLDGGHLLFFGVEAVTGKPVSIRVREMAQQFGMVLLVMLIVFILYVDILRLMAG